VEQPLYGRPTILKFTCWGLGTKPSTFTNPSTLCSKKEPGTKLVCPNRLLTKLVESKSTAKIQIGEPEIV
jgi:hypothetical protein